MLNSYRELQCTYDVSTKHKSDDSREIVGELNNHVMDFGFDLDRLLYHTGVADHIASSLKERLGS
jgi:hypothetical protein